MKNFVEDYINNLSIDDIARIAVNNNIFLSIDETNFIYMFLKRNWKDILDNPESFSLERYKNYFSDENYIKLNDLLIYYRNKYRKFL